MNRLALALFVAMTACSGSSTTPDDSGVTDSGVTDAGHDDAGSPADAGSTDAGHLTDAATPDSGAPDGGYDPGCSVAYHTLFDPVKAGTVPTGATVVGVTDPNEVFTIANGTTHTGDLYVFNHGSVVTAGQAKTTINGAVYLLDDATFHADHTDLAFDQQYSGQFPIIAVDRAKYELDGSKISLGTNPGIIQPAILCGAAQLIATGSDFTVRGSAFLDPFAMNDAHVTLTSDVGSFEVTLDDAAQATISGVTAPSVVGTYFTLRGALGSLPTIVSGTSVTENLAFSSGMAANITGSNIFFGLWVEPAATFTLANSTTALFLTFRGGATSASGLHAGRFDSQTLPLTDRSITLTNTALPVVNVYESALAGAPGQLTLSSSTVGEHNCHGPAGTTCLLNAGTIVDGSGGSLRAEDHGQLTFVGTGYANAGITTYATAVQNSVMRLQNTSLAAGTAQTSVWIDAFDSSLVSLEDSVVGNGVPLRAHDDATIAQGWMAAPSDGGTVSGISIVGGIAQIVTASTSATNAFVSYTLAYNTPGSSTRSVITTSTTPVTAFGALGAWDTTALAAGTYELHLVLTGKAGVISDVVHTVTR